MKKNNLQQIENTNTKNMLSDLIPSDKRFVIYSKIGSELEERLVRLNHNNDVINEIVLPLLDLELSKTGAAADDIDLATRAKYAQELQREENNKAFNSNTMALIMIRGKIKEIITAEGMTPDRQKEIVENLF